MLAFDNMQVRGPRGTTDWTEYAIELPVAVEATNINFGFMLPGRGTAWFDDGSIALDGEEYDPRVFDLDFESGRIRTDAYSDDGSYVASLDHGVAATGGSSLRLAARSREPDVLTATEALRRAETIYADLQDRREAWLAERPEEEVERTLFNARLVVQCMRMRTKDIPWYRDIAMADNVAWLAERHPDARIVLWSHNFHVSRRNGAMGQRLDETFGQDYRPVGFATARGEYSAAGASQERVHRLQPPPPDSFEAVFAAARAPVFAIDLREAVADSASSGWLLEERPFRSIGARASDQQFEQHGLAGEFDLVIFVEETTPTRPLP
jgi:erythromycin esterase-like protein